MAKSFLENFGYGFFAQGVANQNAASTKQDELDVARAKALQELDMNKQLYAIKDDLDRKSAKEKLAYEYQLKAAEEERKRKELKDNLANMFGQNPNTAGVAPAELTTPTLPAPVTGVDKQAAINDVYSQDLSQTVPPVPTSIDALDSPAYAPAPEVAPTAAQSTGSSLPSLTPEEQMLLTASPDQETLSKILLARNDFNQKKGLEDYKNKNNTKEVLAKNPEDLGIPVPKRPVDEETHKAELVTIRKSQENLPEIKKTIQDLGLALDLSNRVDTGGLVWGWDTLNAIRTKFDTDAALLDNLNTKVAIGMTAPLRPASDNDVAMTRKAGINLSNPKATNSTQALMSIALLDAEAEYGNYLGTAVGTGQTSIGEANQNWKKYEQDIPLFVDDTEGRPVPNPLRSAIPYPDYFKAEANGTLDTLKKTKEKELSKDTNAGWTVEEIK